MASLKTITIQVLEAKKIATVFCFASLPFFVLFNLHEYFEIWASNISKELAASKEMLGNSYQSDVALLELQSIRADPRNVTASDHVYFYIPRVEN